ncbi:MAG: hypothetical protein K2N89_03895 [Lachnospiraceae bacterium]|nr:hypothetical protein [Lachnospiraceae bacterium]
MENSEITELQKLFAQKIDEAEMVLVGIGEEFNEDFADIGKFPLLMSALEEVDTNPTIEWIVPFLEKCYIEKHNEGRLVSAYGKLYNLIKDKNYFIVTTCIDGNIDKAGFDRERIVEPCGSYKMLQCSKACTEDFTSPDDFVKLVEQALLDGVGLDSLEQPVCRRCGKPLVFNNILCERNYVESGYRTQWDTYTDWLQRTLNKKICVIELGVGMGLPSVIRWPFEKIAYYNEKADFFRINEQLHHMTKELENKGISVVKNAVDFLNEYDA